MVQNYKNFKILVTGSSGMLGSVYINKSSSIFDLIVTSSSNKDFIHLDITNASEVNEIISLYTPDIILNCSGFTNVDKAEENKKSAHAINVEGLNNLIKYSSTKTKIIHISSDYIYDGSAGPYSEDSLPSPLNYYGKTKHEADNILVSSLRDYLIFRVNGLFSYTKHDNFFNWVFNSLSKNIPINVVDDQISNPILVDRLVDVINESIMVNLSGVYNYGTNGFISRYDFAVEIADYFNFDTNLIKPIKSCDLKQKAKRPLHSGLVCDNIQKALAVELDTIPYILQRFNQA